MHIVGIGDKTCVIAYDDNLKSHLRVFDDEDKDLINEYIKAASIYIEKYIGYPILSEKIEVIVRADGISLELPQSTGSVQKIYLREETGWTEITPETPILDNYNVYKLYYSNNIKDKFLYKVEATLNYCIPSSLQHAAYLLVGEMFENRENRPERYANKVNHLLDLETILL